MIRNKHIIKQLAFWAVALTAGCIVNYYTEPITINGYEPIEGFLFTTAALIAAGISAAVGGTVAAVNAAKAKRARRNANRTLGNMSDENTSNYYKDYYRSALDNDTSRAYLKRLDKQMEKNNKTLDNSVVSTGATAENALAAKESRNQVMSNAITNLAQNEDARKAQIKNQYLNRKNDIEKNKMRVEQNYSAQQQQNLANLGSAVSSAASNAALAFYAPSGASAAPAAYAPQYPGQGGYLYDHNIDPTATGQYFGRPKGNFNNLR